MKQQNQILGSAAPWRLFFLWDALNAPERMIVWFGAQTNAG